MNTIKKISMYIVGGLLVVSFIIYSVLISGVHNRVDQNLTNNPQACGMIALQFKIGNQQTLIYEQEKIIQEANLSSLEEWQWRKGYEYAFSRCGGM